MYSVANFKRSAIHNLRIGSTAGVAAKDGINEGLALPNWLRVASDLAVGEAVIVARIGASNIQNRVHTFVVHTDEDFVDARGSLGHFLSCDDLVCVIAETQLDGPGQELLHSGELLVVDYGITPGQDFREGILKHERLGRADEVVDVDANRQESREQVMPRTMLHGLVTDLVVNATNENCLLGSAEIPGGLMTRAGMVRNTMVSVFNASNGGSTETYAVPMDAGVVMTTGAMSGFAPLGARVHVATFVTADRSHRASIVKTDGTSAVA